VSQKKQQQHPCYYNNAFLLGLAIENKLSSNWQNVPLDAANPGIHSYSEKHSSPRPHAKFDINL